MQKQQKVEKFSPSALADLRTELQHAHLDSRQTAELISAFLSGRGYGVANDDLVRATTPIDAFAGSIQIMQEQLEKLALCM